MTAPQAQQPKQESQIVRLKRFQEETVNKVLAQVQDFQKVGALDLPDDYSPGNALKAAWFQLLQTKDRNDKPALDVCDHSSICNSLMEMVTQGLNPAKKQCAFIVRGNQLTLQREYFGSIALAKRFNPNIADVTSNVIFEKDIFKYRIDPVTGKKHVVEHSQELENVDPDKIRGAYATIIYKDGTSEMEPMTMAQIRKAWNQGTTNGNSGAHKNFTDQMAMKSVINRILKPFINASDDSEIVKPVPQLDNVIPATANSKPLDIEDGDAEVLPTPALEQKPADPEPQPTGPQPAF